MNRTVILHKRKISYELKRKNVKNINLRIRSDCSVYVSANENVADSIISAFLQAKADYILSAIDKYTEITKYIDAKHNFDTGESFRYLGKELRLVVISSEKNETTSDGLYLKLSVLDINDFVLKKKLINKWYDIQCKKIFTEIITEIYTVFKKHGVAMPKLIFRDMTSRWGSCQPKRAIITLNRRLIETSRNSIEYVVMHEFIHFLYPYHSSKFYEMLSTLMPDWKSRKKVLESDMFCVVE